MSDFNFTKDKNISIMESENNIEENYNKINIPQLEYDEFKEPEHEIKWDINLQNTYHFNHDIERVWIIFKNCDLISIISNEGHFPSVNIKGKNTWQVGNIFKGNLYKICPFIAKVEKVVNLPEIKEIKWLFNSIKDNYYFTIKVSLYKVTENNSTVLMKDTKFEKKLTNLGNKLNFNSTHIFKRADELLEKEAISLLRYESGIIRGKMEDIFNILCDSKKLTAIAPNNGLVPEINFKDMKKNERKLGSIFNNGGVQTFDIILRCKEIHPGWNKWIIAFEISGGEPNKIPKHCSVFQITKINNDECQLIMLTKYLEPINSKDFQKYTMKKKYLIMCIKDYFDNFYSPDSSK